MKLFDCRLGLVVLLGLSACGGGTNEPGRDASSADGTGGTGEEESLDLSQEQPEQPFEAINGLRGPGVHVNGIELESERGAVRLMISAFDDGHSIVFRFEKGPKTTADWLAGCAIDEQGDTMTGVSLANVGDVSGNVVLDPDGFTTSIDISQYTEPNLVFTVCGAEYRAREQYLERIEKHIAVARQRAESADAEVRAGLQKECDGGDAPACTELAGKMLHGEGGAKQPEEALALYTQWCDKNEAAACLGAAEATIAHPSPAPNPEAKPRYQAAAKLAVRACELGGKTTLFACYRAAQLHAAGFGVPADPKLVKRLATAACGTGAKNFVCTHMPDLVACAEKNGEACAKLAEFEQERRMLRDDGGEALLRWAACKHGHKASCE